MTLEECFFPGEAIIYNVFPLLEDLATLTDKKSNQFPVDWRSSTYKICRMNETSVSGKPGRLGSGNSVS